MKVALVHELLTMRGGAERVLRVFADMFPEAPIYTLLYNEELFPAWKDRVRVPTYSFPHSLFPKNHHLFLRQFPKVVESWDFFEYDVVISSSSAFAHGIITNGKPKHLSYVHSPARYLWDRTHDVLARTNRLQRWYLERTFRRLRVWDAEAAGRADRILAASNEVQRRIELYWRRESEVLNPPIDDVWFEPAENIEKTEPYYLVVSTLVPYKRIDLAIEACTTLKVPLKIAGDGPDRKRLERMAGPTIEFLGFTDTPTLKKLYAGATAVLFPGNEDFGLVPIEAAACGTPSIGLKAGGALETIAEGLTGEFFEEPTADSLAQVIKNFDQKKYSNGDLQRAARKYRRSDFEAGIRSAIERL